MAGMWRERKEEGMWRGRTEGRDGKWEGGRRKGSGRR